MKIELTHQTSFVYFLKRYLIIMTAGLLLISYVNDSVTASTATATGSGTWNPADQTGTATWSGGAGPGGRPEAGDDIVINPGVVISMTGNGNTYGSLDNNSGSNAGLNISTYSIGFSGGHVWGGLTGTGTLTLSGASLQLRGTYTASNINTTSGNIYIQDYTSGSDVIMNGNVHIYSGAVIDNEGGPEWEVNGDITNDGSILGGYMTMFVRGDVVNNGTWTNSVTNLIDSCNITGTGSFGGTVNINNHCTLTGSKTFNILTLAAEKTLHVNSADTLTVNGEATLNGTVTGTGIAYYNGNTYSANTDVSYIGLTGNHNVRGTYTASFIQVSGSIRIADHTPGVDVVFNGEVGIDEGTVVDNEGGPEWEVNGDITNDGSILGGYMTMFVRGDVVNNGTWTNAVTNLIDSCNITGTGSFGGTVNINNHCTLTGSKTFNILTLAAEKTLHVNSADTLTVNADATMSGTVTGTGLAYYKGNTYSANTDVSYIGLTGNHNVRGVYTAPFIGVSGSIRIADHTPGVDVVFNGEVGIDAGAVIDNEGGPEWEVNGDITNEGSIYGGYMTMHVRGDVVNNGTWTNSVTNLIDSCNITGTGSFGGTVNINNHCTLTGSKTFNILTLAAEKTLHVNSADTLTVNGEATLNGTVTGTGIAYYNGNTYSANTDVSYIGLTGNHNVRGTYTASFIQVSGSIRIADHTPGVDVVFNGEVGIDEGTVVDNEGGPEWEVNGNITNDGSIYGGYMTMHVRGDVVNNGTWTNAVTNLLDSGSLSSSGVFGGTLNILENRSLTGICRIGGTLNLDNNIITTHNDTLQLMNGSTLNRAAGYINGNLARYVSGGSPNLTYEVGTDNGYTPVNVIFNNVTTAGYLTVGLIQGTHPLMKNPSNSLKRYWKFGSPDINFNTYSATLSYLPDDFNTGLSEPSDEDSMWLGQTGFPVWLFPSVSVRNTGGTSDGGTITCTDMTGFSDLAIARDSIDFEINDPPVLSGLTDYTFAEDHELRIPVNAWYAMVYDPENADTTLTWSCTGLNHLTAECVNDTMILRPVMNFSGNDTIGIVATDPEGLSDTAFTVIHVLPINDPPVFTGLPDISFPEDSTVTLSLNRYITDVDNDSNGIKLTSQVIGATITAEFYKNISIFKKVHITGETDLLIPVKSARKQSGGSSIEISVGDLTIQIDTVTHVALFTSSMDTSGTFTVLFTATDDSSAAATDTLQVHVIPVNDRPKVVQALRDTVLNEDFGNIYVSRLSDIFSDIDNPVLTYSAVNLDSGVTVFLEGDSLWLQSQTDFNGTVRVRAGASDGTHETTDTFTVTLSPVNDPPVVANPVPDLTRDEDFGRIFVASLADVFDDVDGGTPVYDAVNLSAGVNAEISGDSLFVLSVPDFTGTVDIRLSVNDGEFTANDTFAVTVQDVNDPPVVVNALRDTSAAEDFGRIPVRLLTEVFGDIDNASLTYQAEVLGAGLTAGISQDTLYLNSELNYYGTVSLRVTAGDGLSTVSDTIDVTVDPVNDDPTVFSLISPADGDTLASITAPVEFRWQSSSDADPDVLSYTLVLYHPDFDTTIAGITDTTVTVDLNGRLISNAQYLWSVFVSDGTVMTLSSDTFAFRTPYVIGIANPAELPKAFSLAQNYPNPFNPATTIHFELPKQARVRLNIYNIQGQLVRTLVNGQSAAGRYHVIWDGSNDRGQTVSSGIYIYRIQAGDFVKTRKMMLLK